MYMVIMIGCRKMDKRFNEKIISIGIQIKGYRRFKNWMDRNMIKKSMDKTTYIYKWIIFFENQLRGQIIIFKIEWK